MMQNERNTKICAITTVPVTMEAFVVQPMDQLSNKGCQVTLVCAMNPAFVDRYQDCFRCISIPMKRGLDPIGAIVAVYKMFRLFRRERFDLIQYATPNAAFYASVAAWIARVPLRVYCQWGIRYVGNDGALRYVFRCIEKLTCRLSTHIRPASRLNLDFAVREGLYPQHKARVIGEGGTIGIDLSEYDLDSKARLRKMVRERHGIGDALVFGFVGRLSRDKGANELLRAFQRISSGNDHVVLLCVGSTEAGIASALDTWARASKQVVFAGPVDHAEVSNYYAAFDCYVHPSYREGFGMVLQEAGAMGCAIITTDIPGASEVMENGISCLLAKPADTDSLERVMRIVMADPTLRASLGHQARLRVERCFARDTRLELLQRDYDELLKGIAPYHEIDANPCQ